jgi:hypothetical protein
MNQIVKMYQESNSRLSRIMSGTYSREQMEDAYREFSAQVKLTNAVIAAFAVISKNKRAGAAMEKMGLMDDHTAIDLGLRLETDLIRCPDQDELIRREECLDYSGTHMGECRGCDHFETSRDMLLDGQKG